MPGTGGAGADRVEPAALALDDRHRPRAEDEDRRHLSRAGHGLPARQRGGVRGERRNRPPTRVHDSALYLAENFERAPAYVIPCIEEDLAGKSGTASIGTLGSIIQAGWSFQLALRARGLGSTWTTIHLGDAKAVAELLGIPAGVTQVALIPVAYTKGTSFRPAKRPPVTEITHWNHWGDTGA